LLFEPYFILVFASCRTGVFTSGTAVRKEPAKGKSSLAGADPSFVLAGVSFVLNNRYAVVANRCFSLELASYCRFFPSGPALLPGLPEALAAAANAPRCSGEMLELGSRESS